MNSRVITKNYSADPEIRLLKKLISKPYDRAMAMPTDLELKLLRKIFNRRITAITHE